MREQSVSSRLRKTGFADPFRAGRLLEEYAQHGIDPSPVGAFAQAASPDQYLPPLTRLVEACSDRQTLSNLLAGLPRPRLLAILGPSKMLRDFLMAHLDTGSFAGLNAVASLGDFTEEAKRRGAFAAVGAGRGRRLVADKTRTKLVDTLRRWYHGRILAIVGYDLTYSGTLGTMSGVSAAISAVVTETLEVMLAITRTETLGAENVDLTVITMGKAGTGEVNYIFGVGVVYVARPIADAGLSDGTGAGLPDGVSEGGGSNRTERTEEAVEDALEVVPKLAYLTIQVISAPAVEPGLWVLDANLRPEGKDGPLVRALESHVTCYKRWVKGREFQVLLKTRSIAGDVELDEDYMAAL